MLTAVTSQSLRSVRNGRLREYAGQYLAIATQFAAQVAACGLPFAAADDRAEAAERRRALQARGAVVRNNDHSVYVNRISPACVACQKGIGSATFVNSLQCHRKCFYCFNPNQAEYDELAAGMQNAAAEVAAIADQGMQLRHAALTGGEPLLHPAEAVAFFRTVRERYPQAHTRLYTSGDQVDRELLGRLKEAGLDEIRFSVRAIDTEAGRRYTYERIALAREFIPCVMVETPVLPGTLPIMQEMLRELDRLGIFGINLLEFCYPLTNPEAYRERGYELRNPPFETLYDYWYAGGLPVAGSELDCLELLGFMLDEGMSMGGHYCSTENKQTGQIFQQNWGAPAPATAVVSERDFFYKTAKVFGDDLQKVRKLLDRAGESRYTVNREHRFLEFHPAAMAVLQHLEVEVAIGTLVWEPRPDGAVLRELKVELTTPRTFDLAADL